MFWAEQEIGKVLIQQQYNNFFFLKKNYGLYKACLVRKSLSVLSLAHTENYSSYILGNELQKKVELRSVKILKAIGAILNDMIVLWMTDSNKGRQKWWDFGSHIRSQNLNIKVIPQFLIWVTIVIEVNFTIRKTRSETV